MLFKGGAGSIQQAWLAISAVLLVCACSASKTPSNDIDTVAVLKQPELLFNTGFENNTVVLDNGMHEKIIGHDESLPLKSNWETDLEKGVTTGPVYLNYTGGDSTKRFAKIIEEPGNPLNKVLWFWLNDSWLASENQQKARVQLDLYNIRGGLREFYQSVRVFLTDDFNALNKYKRGISWLTIAEFWNNEWWGRTAKYGFRVTLGIGKSSGETHALHFILNAENAGQKEVWRANNEAVEVPVGKWFTMDYYYKEGDKNTGRFYMAITPEGGKQQVVFDVTNYTHNTTDPAPNGLSGYNPMKLYTSKEVVAFVKEQGKTLQVYWDDFKLWKDKTPH